MSTTIAKSEDIPSFWKKWWKSFVNSFKRDAGCTCSEEKPPTPKVEETKAEDKKAAA